MIFWFSGTGNSLHVAQTIAKDNGDTLYQMSKRTIKPFEIKEGESVGFVFPVYFYGIPSVVKDFVEALNLTQANYVYAVITCGGGIAGAGVALQKMLKKRNIKLSALWPLLMPDNYIPMYNVKTAEESKDRLKDADKSLSKIIEMIEGREKNAITATAKEKLQSKALYSLYDPMRTTKKFYATDACTSCGLCEKICPTETIKLVDNKPSWQNKKCSQCLACIHRCPAKAIQYGKSTEKRNRYQHPDLQLNNK